MHQTTTHPHRTARAVVARLDAALPGWRESSVRIRDLAAAAGVSPRTLYRAFARQCGEPPIGRLRRERLEGARRHLLEAGPRDTVTSVALDWGFAHLGRFAGSYGRCFGERPSETLRRGRALARERLTPAA
jgi:transcriptional regulator GlxA family with amidase domain